MKKRNYRSGRYDPQGWRKRPLIWKFYHSLWILWTLFPFLNFISFAIIGHKTKSNPWRFFSILYLLCGLALTVFASEYFGREKGATPGYISLIIVISWLLSVVHAFMCRNEYLMRLAIIEDSGMFPDDKDILENNDHSTLIMPEAKDKRDQEWHHYNDVNTLFSDIKSRDLSEEVSSNPLESDTSQTHSSKKSREGKGGFGRKVKESVSSFRPLRRSESAPLTNTENQGSKKYNPKKLFKKYLSDHNGNKVDINTCSEEELKKLPGISIAKAKKTLSLRAERNGFRSLDEYVDAIELAPHFSTQIAPLVFFSSNSTMSKTTHKRILDL